MKFWQIISAPFVYAWDRRTTVTGYLGVFIAVLELNPDTVGHWVAAPKRGTLMLILSMATAGIGHYNNRQRKDDT